jgi:hypothetical protein
MEVLLTVIGYYYPTLFHGADHLNFVIKEFFYINTVLFLVCYYNFLLLFIVGIVLLFVRGAIKFAVINICTCLLFYFLALKMIGDSLQ